MTAKSMNPKYPDADPTAPGGMSRKALVAELVAKHGYEDDKAAWAQVSWPDLIEMVCQERLDREKEAPAKIMSDIMDNSPEFKAEVEKFTSEMAATAEDMMFDLLDPEPLPDGVDYEIEQTPDEELADVWSQVHDMIEDVVEAYEGEGVLDPEQMFAEMSAEHEAATPPPLFIGLPVVKDYIFDGHAGAGPSGAERWMNCTMSLTAARKFLETLSPNQQHEFANGGAGKSAARQGTTAHAVGEIEANLMLGRVDQDEVDLTLLELSVLPEDEGEAYSDEMAEYVSEYVDLVKSYAQERGNEAILIESRVEADIPLTDRHEGEVYVVRGSADMVALPTKAEPTLVVGDLKYGEGLDVDVDENPQIRIYALGVLALLADPETGEIPDWVKDVVYHIIQPRLGGIKTWTETVDDLLRWRDETLAPLLTEALYGEGEGATFTPSELACQWCPARGTCSALVESRVEAAAGLFDEITDAEFIDGVGAFPETSTLTDTRLAELLAMAAGLHDIHKDLKAEAQRRLHRGESVPGYWLVNYTPPRKWKDGAPEALNDIAELWTDPNLVTPTQAEKLLGKEEYPKIEALVIKPDKRPVISTGPGDKRSKWASKPPEQMFEIEEEA